MYTSETHQDINDLKELLNIKYSQLNSLLEVTKAINDNMPSDVLFKIYKYLLNEQLKVNEIALFNFDHTWKRAIWITKEEKDFYIPVATYFTKHSTSTQLNEEDSKIFGNFKYAIPVFHKSQPLALALLGDFTEEHLQTKDELLDFVQIITNIITVAVENKRLFKKEIEKKQFDKELDLASKVQGMLIPKKLPKNNLYEFAGLYLPHKGIGGDYYDVIHINSDEFIFCIGDISGKGVAAALVMANLQAYLNATLGLGYTKEKLIDKLNKKIFSITNGDNYITLFIAKYNIVSHELEYLNAGHIPPLLFNNNELISLTKGTTMLGAFEELPKMHFGKITLQANASLFCVTDGLTELENDAGEQFGSEKLMKLIQDNYKLSPEIFNKILFDDISKFKGNMLFNDDISVLTAKFY